MIGPHGEGDGSNSFVTRRGLGLGEYVVAVIQAGEGKDRTFIALHSGDGLLASALDELLQLEFSAGQRLAVLIYLVDLHLVGEGDYGVLGGLLRLVHRLAVLAHARVVVVDQLYLVHVASLAQHRVAVQRGDVFHHNHSLVQLLVGDLRLAVAPGEGQVEAVVRAGQFVILGLRAVDGHLGDTVEGQALLHGVAEGDVIGQVVGHVVRQRRLQLEGHFVADVIVGGILPAGRLAGGVVDIPDLLLHRRRGGGGILHVAGQARQILVCRQLDRAVRHVAGQAGQHGLAGGFTAVPSRRVAGLYSETDGLDGPVARGHGGLGENVIAVVQALEAEGAGLAVGLIGTHDHVASLGHLRQRERRAGQGLACLIHLVHIHLVSEGDYSVLGGFLRLIHGLAVLVHLRIAAVDQLYLVDIAGLAQHRVAVQLGGVGHYDTALVQSLVGDPRLAIAPGELQIEAISGRGQLIILFSQGHIVDRHLEALLIQRQALVHGVAEGDIVGQVVGHVVRQRRRQAEGHFVADVIVGGILPFALGGVGGIVDVSDLLLDRGFLGGTVLHVAGDDACGLVATQIDDAVHYVAVDSGQHGLALGCVAFPLRFMFRFHGKADGIDGPIAIGDFGLGEDVVAVVQALEAEGTGLVVCLVGTDDHIAILRHLRQRERRTGQGFALLVHLVHVHLVGEYDYGILGSFLGLVQRLAVLVDVRIAAVDQLGPVDVALIAQLRAIVQLGCEFHHDLGPVQGLVRNAGLAIAPGQLQVEGLSILLEVVLRHRTAVHRHGFDGLKGQALLHLVVEGDIVGQVIGHIVRQRRRQHEGHFIADIVVGAVLRAFGLAGGVIGVDDLLLELGLLRRLVLQVA